MGLRGITGVVQLVCERSRWVQPEPYACGACACCVGGPRAGGGVMVHIQLSFSSSTSLQPSNEHSVSRQITVLTCTNIVQQALQISQHGHAFTDASQLTECMSAGLLPLNALSQPHNIVMLEPKQTCTEALMLNHLLKPVELSLHFTSQV